MSYDMSDFINQADPKLLAEETLITQTSEKLWELMETKGVSIEEIASRLKVSPKVLSKMLNGELPMTLRTLALIAHTLDSTVTIKIEP